MTGEDAERLMNEMIDYWRSQGWEVPGMEQLTVEELEPETYFDDEIDEAFRRHGLG